MDVSQVITFTLVAALLVMSPGPNGALIFKSVTTSGRAAGFANVAGFVAAFYLHGALSILGISVLLVQSAQLFFIVKILGAAYLCWIGINALRAAWKGSAVTQSAQTVKAVKRQSSRHAFLEGFLTNALNPKVSMFYLAAFPQFIPMGEGASAAFLLVFVHSVINLLWFSGMVILLSRFMGFTRAGVFQRVLKAVTGVVFVTFGIKLASFEA
ncbi:LysE family translocator [Aliamphritea ceti]|uniref:LysE family translocator n=1 Tax=Aliamphritea ceti TaxID=1524258 RepID=UPI0021C2FADB|nr:LysE family translocator [Aliamphritea ceti]